MATWYNLGTITPSINWQQFDLPIGSNIKTFRATFGGDLGHCWYHARFRQYFYSDSTGFSQRIYPRQGSIIFEMPVPEELIDAGMYIVYIGIKKKANYRNTVIDGDWTVHLEYL